MLGENLAHRIISSYSTWLQGPQKRPPGKTVLVANLLGEGRPNPPEKLKKLSPGELVEMAELSCGLSLLGDSQLLPDS